MALTGNVGPGGILTSGPDAGKHYLDVVSAQTTPTLNNAFANQMHIMGITPTPTQVYNNPTPAWDTLDWSATNPARAAAPASAPAPAPAPVAAPASAPAAGSTAAASTQQPGAPNPYLNGIADSMAARSMFQLGQSLNGIRGNAVATGGLGGSRQGVAEGIATGLANQGLLGELSALYGSAYDSDQNRNLQRYGLDINRELGWGNINQQRYATDKSYDLGMTNANNNRYATDLNYQTANRGLDLDSQRVGGQLAALNAQLPWVPLQNMADIYGKFANGNGTATTGGSNGFDWGKFLGDAGSIYQTWKASNKGWF